MSKNKKADRPLQQILEDALKGKANAVEFEYVSEGLEVSYMFGNTGVGSILTDREVIRAVTTDIVENAGLEEKTKGKISIDLLGKIRTITVEEWDSFGESAFRLTFS